MEITMSEVETTDAPTEAYFVEAGEALKAADKALENVRSQPALSGLITLDASPDATIEVGTVDSDDGSEAQATADLESSTEV
jgi:hypothetical protein